ncbi:MAG: two-component regulator propeller domain-containing protein, partial [Maribacter sp.]
LLISDNQPKKPPLPHTNLLTFTKRFLTITLLFCGVFVLPQDDKIAFEKYGVAEGLPEEFISSIVQDDQGFIWATTQNGLVKFDGYKMQVFKEGQGKGAPIRIHNLNGGLLLGRDGQLWMGAYGGGGLISFDPEIEKFLKYPIDHDDTTKVPYPDCTILMEDIVGAIWFSSVSPDDFNDSFLCRIDPKNGVVSRYPYQVGRVVNALVLNWQMAESKKDSSLWLNVEEGSKLLRFDRKKDSFELIFKKGDLLPGTDRRDSILDIVRAGKSGLISMGYNQRLYLWDPLQRKVVESYDFPSHKDASWWTEFEDRQGNIWSTAGGEMTLINRQKSQRNDYTFGQGVLAFQGAPKEIIGITPFFQNDAFLIFQIFGDTNVISHLRYDFNTGTFDFFDRQFNDGKNEFARNGAVYKFLMDKTGLLWVGTRPNLYKQAPKKRQIGHYTHDPKNSDSIPNDSINVFFQDSKERLWIGTRNGISLKGTENTYRQYYSGKGTNPKKPLGIIRQIYEDSKGRIWVSDHKKGLFRLNEGARFFERIEFLSNAEDIPTIIEDAKGRLWVSVWERGVYMLDAASGNIIKRFEGDQSENHLLTSNTIFHLFKDSGGQIWLGDPRADDKGLFKYVEEKEQFQHYRFNGQDTLSLSSNEIRLITEDDLGRMWVGTDGGLNLYNQSQDNFLRNNNLIALPSISNFARDVNGKMWFTSYSGGGLALVGPGINEMEVFGEDKGLLHNDIMGNRIGLLMDDFGKLWLPTERGLSVFDTTNKT